MSDGTDSDWGRVADDGTVYVRTPAGERAVGSWRAGSPEEGLAHFTRRYADLVAEVELLERRLGVPSADPTGVAASARRLRESLTEAAVVGDLAALQVRLDALLTRTDEARARVSAARAERSAQALAAKEALLTEAEKIAKGSDWKATSERFRTIGEEFRAITGLDRRSEADVWKKIAAAREEFNRRRTAHFAALDAQRAVSRERKEAIIAEAEKLVSSSDWGPTSNRYRALMTQWKSAGRAPREIDDELWARFRAAQDAFFARRNAVNAERDAELRTNQEAKEKLLVEAEAIDTGNPEAAARRLRQISERWDAAGRVPREAAAALERRLAAVSDRVREANDARWRRQEIQDSPFVASLRESVAKLEAKLARERAAGRDADAKRTEAALATQREWLNQAT
jgi:Domain of Unknown Function (DUF349)